MNDFCYGTDGEFFEHTSMGELLDHLDKEYVWGKT